MLCRAMFWMYINGECVTQPRDAEAGGLWHAVIKTPRWANLCLPAYNWKWVALCQPCIYSNCLFLLSDSTENMVRKQKKYKTYTQWKHEQKGRVLWCQWSLIKFLSRRGRVCGWKRNVCVVFALCPPQATVPPEALYISLTLLPVTLWLWSYPQPAPTSDPCTKRPSIMFLSLCFCSRGYLWGQTWPHWLGVHSSYCPEMVQLVL